MVNGESVNMVNGNMANIFTKMPMLNVQGGFFNWPPPKSSKYKKVNLG